MRSRQERLVRAVWNLLRTDAPTHPEVVRRQWVVLAEDAPLLAFFESVQAEDGWFEERMRVGRDFVARRRGYHDPIPGHPISRLSAVRRLLPFWRRWGKRLLDAEKMAAEVEALSGA